MEPTFIIAIVVLAAIVAAYVLFVRKPASPPKLEGSSKALPGGEPDERPTKRAEKPALRSGEKPALPAADKAKLLKRETPAAEDEEPEEAPDKAESKADQGAKRSSQEPPASGAVPRPSGGKAPPVPVKPAVPARKRDVAGLRVGLSKVRANDGFFGRLRALFGGRKEIDPQVLEQIEEVLLTSDVGVKTTEVLLEKLRSRFDGKDVADSSQLWDELRHEALSILSVGSGGIALSASPTVVMVVGVNGVGKTTTIGKLATKFKAEGKKVVLAAGDTFRAAAVEQLNVWGKRVDAEVVTGKEGANPGAVIFDAIQRAKEIGAHVVLADTAGRLHTKSNLMEELGKISRTMAKAIEGAPHETLLVLDATNGQNALQQAAMFKEAVSVSGIILTKLDGTAKGGVILGICAEHKLPVRYIGVGERAEDLRDFIAEEFVEAMLGPSEASEAAA